MTTIREVFRFSHLLYRQHLSGFPVLDGPIFDEESLLYFMDVLRGAKSYLEYGSGGSTLAAAAMSKPFITVESDKYYLASVKNKILRQFPNCRGAFLHGDIGITKEWGYPLFQKKTPERLSRWLNYSETPWNYIHESQMVEPDLILVDGRFRVCSALVSIKWLPPDSNYTLLVDDYIERPNYWRIEQFATLAEMRGRMAIFKPKKIGDREALDRAIGQVASDLT